MDATSGVPLALKNGVPTYQVENAEGRLIYCFTCQSRKRLNTAGVSGGLITQALIRGPFLMVSSSNLPLIDSILRSLPSTLILSLFLAGVDTNLTERKNALRG
jgi:hypothetical protein